MIPYFEMARTTTDRNDGAVLLDKVTSERAEQYVRNGAARAERRKDGTIRKLWRIPRARHFISPGACVAFINGQASTTVPVVTEEGRRLPHLWSHKAGAHVDVAVPIVSERTA